MTKSIQSPLIHIGYHKTGSSWLQHHLFTDSSDVFFPLSRNPVGQSTLSKHFIMDDNRRLLSSFNTNIERIQRELDSIQSLKGLPENRVPVISQERLSGNPEASGFDARNIAWRIETAFPEAKILIVVREQKSFIRSHYFSNLAYGSTDSFEQYINAKYDGIQPYFSPHHIDYIPLVQDYVRRFGDKSVLVLTYEQFKQQPEEFVASLERFLNIQCNVNSNTYKESVNKMTSPFFNYYLRNLNRFRKRTSHNHRSLVANKHSDKLIKNIFNNLGRVSVESWNDSIVRSIDRKIDTWVGDRYLESNKQLNEYTQCNLREYGYY